MQWASGSTGTDTICPLMLANSSDRLNCSVYFWIMSGDRDAKLSCPRLTNQEGTRHNVINRPVLVLEVSINLLSDMYLFCSRHPKNNHTKRCGYFLATEGDFTCSGQMNCPCAKFLAFVQNACTAHSCRRPEGRYLFAEKYPD